MANIPQTRPPEQEENPYSDEITGMSMAQRN